MSDSNDTPTAMDGASDQTGDVSTLAFSSNYKVLGYEQSASGTTYGVLGQVDSAGGYGLGTPDLAWAGGGGGSRPPSSGPMTRISTCSSGRNRPETPPF